MDIYGVKETQCTRCGHRDVCSLKEEFLEAQKVGIIHIRDIKYIEPIELHCKHYIPNIGVTNK